MSNNAAQQIASFLMGQINNPAVVAGILGNLKVESGFNSSAYNAREGAIGIAQWEGGRRTALQQFAHAHGGAETDLNIQLQFLWHELSAMDDGSFMKITEAGSAASAAAAFDQYFERSAGTSRSQRVSYAQQFASGYSHDGGFTNLGAAATDSYSASPLGGQSPAGGATDYKSELDSLGLGGLLDAVPELKGILKKAQSSDWSVDKFQNAVEDTAWYKRHGATARSIIAERVNDPATYGQDLKNAEFSIRRIAGQAGWGLSPAELRGLAANAMLTGNSDNSDWLTAQLAGYQNFSRLKSTKGLKGGMAATVGQLQQMYADYGVSSTPARLAAQAQQILAGSTTLDTFQEHAKTYAKSAFPGLASQIDAGQTVSDIAAPYIQTMSGLLEVDPSTLSVQHTGLVRKALQGTAAVQHGQSTPVVTPLWQFEDHVRQDPRWQYTDNAHQAMATTALQLGQAWGFNG